MDAVTDAGLAGGGLRCGPVEIRPGTRQCLIDGQPVDVERRSFDLIVYLMQHADRVVEKEELLREVWGSRPVSESTVAQAVSRARKALGSEDPEAFIATVYGVGYRFAQQVTAVAESATSVPQRAAPAAIIWLALVTALLALGLALWQLWPARSSEQAVRVAILPVQNQTGNAELDWVSYGVLPLLDSTLADAGVPRVSSGTVLATLRRYPDLTDPNEQAETLRLSTGAEQVLIPRLTNNESGYRLTLSTLTDPDEPFSLELDGEDISVLAVAAGNRLTESLARWKGSERARRNLVTDDPFLNEAFARGLDARLRGRFEEAARFFDTVLAAAPDLHQAKYHLSLVTRRLGDWDYTDQLNQELLASAEAEGDLGMLAAAQSVSGVLAWRRGDKPAAERWYHQALANYQAMDNQDYVASTQGNLGILASTRGQYGEAETLMLQALAHYQRINDRYNQATTLKNLGNLYNDQAQYDTAEQYLTQSLEIRQQLRLPLQIALTLSNLADIEMARGHWPEALAYQQRVLAAAEEFDNPVLESQTRSDLAASLRILGRLNESREMSAQALTIATQMDHPTNQAFALVQQGRTEQALRHWRRAAELFDEAAVIYRRIEEPLGEANSVIARGHAELAQAQVDLARQSLADAAAIVNDSQLQRLEPDLALLEGKLHAFDGDHEPATQAMTRAFELAQQSDAVAGMLNIGGELGLYQLSAGVAASELDALVVMLTPRAEASERALAFLSRYHEASNPTLSVQFEQRRKQLLGEGWTAEDEQRLTSLQQP